MELGVGQGLECLPALLFRDEALSLEIVEGEDILELGVLVDNASVTLGLPCFESFDKFALNVLGLAVG